jgi:Flp pilus assembly protein TadB
MLGIAELWLPILVAGVLVFIVSALLHMAFSYHDRDYRPLPDEAAMLAALTAQQLGTGNFSAPRPANRADARSEAFRQKQQTAPMVMMNVLAAGRFSMGRTMLQWFIYCVLVSLLVAYVAGHALGAGASYLAVFRVAGAAAFLAYAAGQPMESIWFMRSWSSCLKNVCDGLVYALVTGGAFGWLWPRLAGA